jgi:hypothetical protein
VGDYWAWGLLFAVTLLYQWAWHWLRGRFHLVAELYTWTATVIGVGLILAFLVALQGWPATRLTLLAFVVGGASAVGFGLGRIAVTLHEVTKR